MGGKRILRSLQSIRSSAGPERGQRPLLGNNGTKIWGREAVGAEACKEQIRDSRAANHLPQLPNDRMVYANSPDYVQGKFVQQSFLLERTPDLQVGFTRTTLVVDWGRYKEEQLTALLIVPPKRCSQINVRIGCECIGRLSTDFLTCTCIESSIVEKY